MGRQEEREGARAKALGGNEFGQCVLGAESRPDVASEN